MSKRPIQQILPVHDIMHSPQLEGTAKAGSLKKSTVGLNYRGDQQKKQKGHEAQQTSILNFYLQNNQGETPALGGRVAQAWPSTAQRKLERLAMVTPVLDDAPSSIHVSRSMRSGGTQRSSQPSRVPISLAHEASLSGWAGDDDVSAFSLSQNMTVVPTGHNARGNENLMDAFMQGHSQHGCNMGGSQATLYPPQLQSQHALEEQGSSQPWPGQLEEPVGQPPRLSLHGREKLVPFAPQHFDAQPANSTGPAVTPEVHLSASLEELQELQDDASMVSQAHPDQSNAAAQPTKVASIFTKGFYKKKLLVLIRHGQSTYNAGAGGRVEPDVWDAPLTELGMKQARKLRVELHKLIQAHRGMFGEPLFVTSPLTRAIQTTLNMIPYQEELKAGQVNLAVCDLHTEHLKTSGDIGRPRNELIQEFPQLEPQLMAGLPEGRWWYQKDDRTNCALEKVNKSNEPRDKLMERVGKFRGWLRSREERFIVVVGHSLFFNKFDFQGEDHMKNCELKVSKNL